MYTIKKLVLRGFLIQRDATFILLVLAEPYKPSS